MNLRHTVFGQQKKWVLVDKIGEGDAGEVYIVESLLESKPAILKRPRKDSYPSDVLRQASQIRTEGKILNALNGIKYPELATRLSTPALLDQSLTEDGLGSGYFIIIDRAAGFDLKSLQRVIRAGRSDDIRYQSGEEQAYFVQALTEANWIPEAILIRTLYTLINFLETIHTSELWNDGVRQYGIIWNDIKPEHLYWDPARTCLTVIDWGNGNFLEEDGITKDRQHSATDDYHQFILAMGGFLAESNPELYKRLEWPAEITPGSAYNAGVKPLKVKLTSLHEEAINHSQELRAAVSALQSTSRPTLEHLSESDDLHRQIVAIGEMPDFASAENFHARVALQMAAENRLDAFEDVCRRTAKLATSSTDKWLLLADLAAIDVGYGIDQTEAGWRSFANTLSAGIADDWPAVLWELYEMIGEAPLPDWWENVSHGVRRVHLKLGADSLTPDVVVRRLFYTLQTSVLQMGDKRQAATPDEDNNDGNELLAHQDILKIFDEEVVKKWQEPAPAPPNSGIGYADIDGIIDKIEVSLPGTRGNLKNVLQQPKAQADIVLSAWERKDFETARHALRRLLLWDPYRRRLLQADRSISSASSWLADVRNGAGSDEPFYEYLSSIELAGRNLRNRVGPANWLDLILDALRRLRKGIKPADLVMEHPELSDEIPWLNEFRSREILSLPRIHPMLLERENSAPIQVKTVTGEVDGRLGADFDLQLGEPLDTWAPEARGSSARVFVGYGHDRTGKPLPLAVKIMRPDRLDYALPLFREEAHILSLMRDVPGITPLIECGFLNLEEGLEFPADDRHGAASHLKGRLVRYGVEDVQNFLATMERQMAQGWLPYLALVLRDQQYNLLRYCDAGYTRGWFLPLRESLLLAIQICDILQFAHDRNIVYQDHKILHYYWDPASNGVVMIDWNIAKRQSQGLSDAERQFDLVQFGARALHYIITGRPAPGALAMGPNKPEEIEQASLSYAVSWTYDDERLPIRVKEILENVLNQGYNHVKDLRADLVQLFQQVPEPVQDSGSAGNQS